MNALGMQTIVAGTLRRRVQADIRTLLTFTLHPVRKDSVVAAYAEPVHDVLVALVPPVQKVMANENERIQERRNRAMRTAGM